MISLVLDKKIERNISMNNNDNSNTNAFYHQTLEELSEHEMQTINSGAKIGNPEQMLREARDTFSPSSSFGVGRLERSTSVASTQSSAPANRSSSGSSFIDWTKRPATKGAAGAIAVGGVTAFGVGAVAG
jgi:hypothetical protein